MPEITKVYGGRAWIEFVGTGGKHYYTVNVPELNIYDLLQPSVTSVIAQHDKSPALVHWATHTMHKYAMKMISTLPDEVAKAHVIAILNRAINHWRSVKEETADIGSVVHRVLEQELKARAGLCPHPKLPLVADPILAPELTEDMLEQANQSIAAGLQFFDEHDIQIIQAESVRWSPKYGYLGTGDLIAKYDGMLAALDYKSGKRLYPSVWMQLAAYQKAWEEEHPDQPLELRVGVNVGRDGKLETKTRNNETVNKDFAAFLGLLRVWRWDYENDDFKNRDGQRQAPQIVGEFYNQ